MGQARLIKSRIKSAQNISKITKAMEMVSASKMRRSQQQALASRPYTHKLVEMLHTIASHVESGLHPLLEQGNPKAPQALLIVSTDRGLAGSLNANLFRQVSSVIDPHSKTVVIVVGKKAREFALKMDFTIVAEFLGLPDRLSLSDVIPISQLIIEGFLHGEFSKVTAVFMQFVSTLTQKPEATQLLPISIPKQEKETGVGAHVNQGYLFEPNSKQILELLLPYYVENSFFQLMLEAKASEHSARMVAMKSASDNAKDVVSSLRLEYNKSRQAGITAELLDITTASLSVKG